MRAARDDPGDHRATTRDTARDTGQVALLTLVFVLVLVLALGVTTAASSLYLARKRLFDVADATALAVADDFALAGLAGDRPRAEFDDATVRLAAAELLDTAAARRIDGIGIGRPTGRAGTGGVQVTVTGTARPPLLVLLVPDGVELSATARARLVFTTGP